jgi:hypothetical protein
MRVRSYAVDDDRPLTRSATSAMLVTRSHSFGVSLFISAFPATHASGPDPRRAAHSGQVNRSSAASTMRQSCSAGLATISSQRARSSADPDAALKSVSSADQRWSSSDSRSRTAFLNRALRHERPGSVTYRVSQRLPRGAVRRGRGTHSIGCSVARLVRLTAWRRNDGGPDPRNRRSGPPKCRLDVVEMVAWYGDQRRGETSGR